MTIAGQLATYTKIFNFETLPPEVIHQAKRVLIDALGCCLGAYDADAVQIVHNVVKELGGPCESTVIGSGLKSHCIHATLVNGMMVRYLDYNDLYAVPAGKWYVASHPSDSIPAILAIGERMHSPGQDVINAVVLSYELSARFSESATNPPLASLGWNDDTRGAYTMPLVAGKLLGLNEGQLENAVGISGCHGMILGILDTGAEENCMSKSLRFHFTSCDGIMAALLAQKGFTGPTTILEGTDGFIQTVMKGRFNVDKLTEPDDKFYIMDTGFKSLCAVGAAHGHLSATLHLANKYNIQAEDVEKIKITAGTRPIEHTGDPAKKYPINKETADHSSYYLTAIAVLDRTIGPEQYKPWKYKDPKVLSLIEKVSLGIDKEMDKVPRSGMSEITTRTGKTYSYRVDYPKGHLKNPMSDRELEVKFKSMARKYMTDPEMEAILQKIYHLESLQDIGDLMNDFVFKKGAHPIQESPLAGEGHGCRGTTGVKNI